MDESRLSPPPDLLHRLMPRRPSELNKRGQVLVILGIIWVVIGVNVQISPNPAGWEHIWVFTVPPVELRSGAWILTGTVAILFALRPRWISHDGFAFLALYLMPAERAFGFLWGWLDSVCPPLDVFGWFVMFEGPGYSRGLLGALVYLVFVVLIMVIADWPDPPPGVPVEDDSEGSE